MARGILAGLLMLLGPLPHRSFVQRAWPRPRKGLRRAATGETRPTSHPDGRCDHTLWSGAFRSQKANLGYELLPEHIRGRLPADLEGTLFRNIPSLFERGNTSYGHFLDGDGKVLRLTFQGGRVRVRNRFVETKAFMEEEDADEVRFRSAFRTQRPARLLEIGGVPLLDLANAGDLVIKNNANTNVILWGGILLALYEAGVPVDMDPRTLATRGVHDLGLGDDLAEGVAVDLAGVALPGLGKYATAHPKMQRRKEGDRLISWTWNARPAPTPGNFLKTTLQVFVYEWDEAFRVQRGPTRHTFPDTAVVPHDFSLTERHYVFIKNRLAGNQFPYLLGVRCAGECVAIERDAPMELHLVPRGDPDAAAQILALAPGFTIHSPAAFERDGHLHLYTSAWRAENITSGRTGGGGLLGAWEGRAPEFPRTPQTLLYRTIVDLEAEKVVSHGVAPGLETVSIDHPHIHPDFEGRPIRYLWMSLGGRGSALASPGIGLARYDAEKACMEEWLAPQAIFTEEPIVVARESGREEDTYVLVSYYDGVEERSGLYVFDGADVRRGPLCDLQYPHALPHGLHGTFTSKVFNG